jgi:hypothetical protein
METCPEDFAGILPVTGKKYSVPAFIYANKWVEAVL